MAFFNTPEIERLYSGVTNSTPFDFCSFSRNATQSAGGVGFQILIEKRNAVQGDDVELQRIGRQLGQRVGDLEREALFAKAADDDDNGVRGGHGELLC